MPKSTHAFQQAYARLNKEQKVAVDTIDGPVMVVAGPGTGKTQTIALRIANILRKTDTDPDAILALTFTESAAKEMRTRLADFIGQTAYYVTISTFHSFCTDVIRENPEYFHLDPSAESLSDLERLKTFHEILDAGKFKELRPINAPHMYTKALMGAIQDLKREAVDPDEFEDILKEEEQFLASNEVQDLTKTEIGKRVKDLAKNKELLTAYREYQKNIRESGRFDFEDMINFVTDAFKNNKDLLTKYQERFHYFLVDEYQDTNSAQNEVVDLLASYWGSDANVFVVGDPSQSIFRFQGASIENTLSFIKTYKNAMIMTLRDNYRSSQTILDAAHKLIENNNLRIENVVEGADSHLRSASNRKGTSMRVARLSSDPAENLYIAEKVQTLIKLGTKPGEIAIIFRNNADAPEIADTLAKFNIDYTTQGGGNILEDPTVKRLIKIFRVIRDVRYKKDDLDLFTILHYDIFAIEPLDILKISRVASESKRTLFDVLENKEVLKTLSLRSEKQLDKVLDHLAKWQSIDANTTFVKFFETILNESGYLSWVLKQKDAHHKIGKINTLFREAKKMNAADHNLGLEGFLHNLDLMEQNNLKVAEPEFTHRKNAVTLTTAHSAKGLEWEYIFIYRSYDGRWGNSRVRELIHLPEGLLPNTDLSKKEKNEDERRLFYVALTRAKKEVYITSADTYATEGRIKETTPTMFLEEIPDRHKRYEETAHTEDELVRHMEKLLTLQPQTDASVGKREKEFLEELVSKFKLSVTALNTYLECPYKFKLNNLLRVPRAKEAYLSFGTAVHTALERFYNKLKEDSLAPPKTFLVKEFEKELEREVLTPRDQEERLEQGRRILSAYYDFFAEDFVESIENERWSRVVLGDITLTGKIDRLEWDDQSDRTIRVVDYKTGSPKTRGQIEGTTQDSQGNLKRQLIFYKLLIDLDRRLKVSFGEGELDFVEAPDRKNKAGRERFKISPEEADELKQVIRSVMADIRALKFPRTTDYTICARCEFKDHCWPSGIPRGKS